MKLENHEISVLVEYHAGRIAKGAESGALSTKWAHEVLKRIEELQAEWQHCRTDF